MTDLIKGHCSHGFFDLMKGCPQCIAEFAGVNSPANIVKRIEDAKEHQESKLHIVKVKYYSATTGELGDREYTYFSVDSLKMGEVIIVPVRDTTTKAQVSAVDVPEATAIALRPGEDIEVHSYFEESMKILEYAERRTITTIEDARLASDDLIIIRKVKKAIEEKRKEYLSPLQSHIKEVNESYKILMEPIEQADKITAGKMLAFDAEQKHKIREAEAIEAEKLALARREAALKGGEITVDLTPVEKPEAVPDRIRTDMGSSGQRDNWKWEVQDISQVPREYLMINAGMLTPIVKASKGKIVIPGVRIFNEPIIAVTTH